jgi:hypothetical protein
VKRLTYETDNPKVPPKTKHDHYGELKALPVPKLEKSGFIQWIESDGVKEENPQRFTYDYDLPWRHLDLTTKFRSCNTRHLKEVGVFRTGCPELFGDAGYKLVDDAYASFAHSEFKTAQMRGQLKKAPNCDIREIASFIVTAYDIQNFPVVIAEVSDARVRVQLYKGLPVYCPYDVRRGDYRLCMATAGYERELVKLCNPKYRAWLSRTKAIGDDCCELTIELDPNYKGKK